MSGVTREEDRMGWLIWLPLIGILLASLAYHLGLLDASAAHLSSNVTNPQPQNSLPAQVPTTRDEIQYAAIVQMVTFEAQNFWGITSAFLVAETIIAAIATGKPENAPAAISSHPWLLPAIGLIASLIWLSALLRSLGYTKFRIHQARELERRLGFDIFINGLTMSRRGVAIADGVPVRMGLLGRALSIRVGGIVLASLFAGLFAYLFQEGWNSVSRIMSR